MKKIVKLVFLIISVILISLCSAKNVYGVSNCKVNLFIEKNEYKIDDEITVYVNISDIQSELGIFTGMMTLDYDKDSLELLKIEGLNSWDTPILNSSYNSDNGKMVITKSGFAKDNENILKISFKAKANDEDANISIRNVSFSDSNLIRVEGVSQNIVIKDEKSTVPSEPESKEPGTENPEPTIPDNQEQDDYELDKSKKDETNNNNNQNEDSTEKNENQENETEKNTVIEEDKNQTTIYPILNDDEQNTIDANDEVKSDDSRSKLKLPKTGEKNAILIISIIIFTICIIFVIHSGIGYVKSNKKIKDNDDEDDNDNDNDNVN